MTLEDTTTQVEGFYHRILKSNDRTDLDQIEQEIQSSKFNKKDKAYFRSEIEFRRAHLSQKY